MAATRTLGPALRCASCQRHVLSAFISSFQHTLQTRASSRISFVPVSKNFAGSLRRYHATTPLLEDVTRDQQVGSQVAPEALDTEKAQLDEGTFPDDINVEPNLDQAQEATSKPWYLQLEDVIPDAPNPFAARQQMPELPLNPPPILEPLLKQISVDLGLDYLSIVDLRRMDPPPALGAGLVMIFGSVRSERHLNVSADRLCRWLRSEHKLTPHADGLVGRNELKLKLRRRARRTKMLSAAGAAEPSDPDDGISTGWICVSVGEVEDGPGAQPEQRPVHGRGFVGFGRQANVARVVVQMMTEEKRNEMDLEGLWQAMLQREERKKVGEHRAWEKLDLEAAGRREDSAHLMEGSASRSAWPSSISEIEPPEPRYGTQTVRRYHTSARRLHADTARVSSYEGLRTLIGNDYESEFSVSPPSIIAQVAEINSAESASTLRSHVNHLKTEEAKQALEMLGTSENDRTSTAFLQSYYTYHDPFPRLEQFLCSVELQCHALRLGHPGYTRLRLIEIFRDMQACGIWIPEQLFLLGLEATLMSEHQVESKDNSEPSETDRLNGLRRSLGFAFELIERMEAHGYDTRTEAIFLLILDAISSPQTGNTYASTLHPSETASATPYLSSYITDKLQHKLRRALDALYEPTQTDDPVYVALMETCIRMGHWSGFWESFRHIARMGKRRGPSMYALMFGGVARSKSVAQCRDVLQMYVAEMRREKPPVPMEGDVAQAVLECLVAAEVNEHDFPWVDIVASCKQGLGVEDM